MRKVIFFIAVLSALTGCSTLSNGDSSQNNFKQATQIVNQPVVIPTQPSKQDFLLAYGNNPALVRAYQQYIKTGKAPNIVTTGFEQFAYGASQPIVSASPMELTVISLEPGENVTNVSSGDPLRWSYSLAYSGGSQKKQPHVMVKPSQPGISTDLVITTDKRMYTIKMVSGDNGKYVRDVRFWYPDEIQAYWDNYNAQQTQGQQQSDVVSTSPNVDLNKMNFDYSISAPFFSAPAWKPTRVFDDGTHTYIQFPDSVNNQDMPALFIVNGDKQELVNYRSKKPYFVVDKIFKQAALIIEVGNNQTKVVITNNHYD